MGLFELGGKAEQRRLIAIAAGEHHRQRQPFAGQTHRHRHGRLTGQIGNGRQAEGLALAAVELAGAHVHRIEEAQWRRRRDLNRLQQHVEIAVEREDLAADEADLLQAPGHVLGCRFLGGAIAHQRQEFECGLVEWPAHFLRPFLIANNGDGARKISLGFVELAQVNAETRQLDHGVTELAQKLHGLLGELGHTMIELPRLSEHLRRLYKAQGYVSGAVAVVGYEEWAEKMQRPLDVTTLEWLALSGYRAAKEVVGKDVAWGLQTIRQVSREILAQYRNFDVLLQPIQITPPPPLGFLDPMNVKAREFNRRQGQTFGLTPVANLTGQPAMSVPMGLSSDRLPLAMMFSGRYGDEATLFRLAAQLEQASPWIDRKPPIWG